MKSDGDTIIALYKELMDKAGVYGKSLDSATKAQEKMTSNSFAGWLKELSNAWNQLSLAQRKGGEGQMLIAEFIRLSESAGQYAGTLAQVAKEQNALTASKTVKQELNELTAKWDALTIAQRKGAQGKEIIDSFKRMTDAAGVYIGSIQNVIAEQERLAKMGNAKRTIDRS